eukprot:CAMPEP_0198244734 /NCGR_PEP_ID=MMETSP1446-20131203/37313_1 /TAXON_ID=1461542 ORGANISM="Unidentified sp, Strain CCMP2111" /NCGR_SAMPLE_ID=MMETSP1446 /ASSEMBLY_ACC=CAM_ASM_001112 /LENGTH=78 /DNA_ID=CAMNT_0043928831 /DNA_START=61 /DNA_END=294 /DNA_ORIENTATION=-
MDDDDNSGGGGHHDAGLFQFAQLKDLSIRKASQAKVLCTIHEIKSMQIVNGQYRLDVVIEDGTDVRDAFICHEVVRDF